MGGETTIIARGGRFFAPQLDSLVLSLTEYRYFPEIPWLSYLPVHMRVLKFAWWSRDWIDITCSLLMYTVRTKWAGNDAASNLAIVELIMFVSCVQNRDHDHELASLCCTYNDF